MNGNEPPVNIEKTLEIHGFPVWKCSKKSWWKTSISMFVSGRWVVDGFMKWVHLKSFLERLEASLNHDYHGYPLVMSK